MNNKTNPKSPLSRREGLGVRLLFRRLHLWLSVPFGLIITVICLSGAALVFEKEVMELCRPELYHIYKVETTENEASPVPLSVDRIAEIVSATLPDSVSVTSVTVSSSAERTWQVALSKPRRASVFVNPYTGEIKGRYEWAPFFRTMFYLHRWLLDSMKPGGGIFWGRLVVGTATLMFVFVLISGIIVWWPRTRKALKNSLKIVVGKGSRRLWYSLHVAGGMYALVLLLAMALTGLTWSFPWYRTGFYKLFGVEMGQQSGHGGGGRTHSRDGKDEDSRSGNGKSSPFAHWQKVYEELASRNPQYRQITLSPGAATVSFHRFGNQRAVDRYMFNPQTGEITQNSLYQDADASGKIRGWIYSVHVGSWGGWATRILTFLAALVGASLPLTGYYLWIKRLMRKSRVR